MGFLITYKNCPNGWGSKMQTLVALSTMEAEIIALSTALQEVIHLQLCCKNFKVISSTYHLRSLISNVARSRTMQPVAQLEHKYTPGQSTSQYDFFIFVIMWTEDLSQLNMWPQHTNWLIYLPNHYLVIKSNVCEIHLWVGPLIFLLIMRECEV